MAVNIKVRDRFAIDTETDSMGRSWAGWDENSSDQSNWDHNRGRHTFGDRVDEERYATLSHNGRIRLVAELTGRRQESNPRGTGNKWSLEGRVLAPGDPVREAFMRLPAPAGRNSIAYIEDPVVAADRKVFLLTNNPQKWDIDPDLLAEWVEATAEGHSVEDSWSTGSTTRKISRGDRAFLLRQGVADRGIFASGTFASGVSPGGHWDESGGTANFANVIWDTVIDPGAPLSIDVLLDRLPEAQWEPRSSGTQVNPTVVTELEELWASHVASVRRTPSPPTAPSTPPSEGQGRRLDARLRKQIEDVAQARLTAYYEGRDWEVEDRRYGNPFDAKATKGGEVRYLEAKGTTTAGKRVIVTRNEVAFARAHPDECIMGVVSGMTLGSDGDVDPSSGVLSLYVWEPATEDLDPLRYDFYPPSSHLLSEG